MFKKRYTKRLEGIIDRLVSIEEKQSINNELVLEKSVEMLEIIKDRELPDQTDAESDDMEPSDIKSSEALEDPKGRNPSKSRVSGGSNTLTTVAAIVSAIAVVGQGIILYQQIGISNSQMKLSVQQQVQGTDSYDYSISELISVSSPENGRIEIRNSSATALFDFYVRLQGVAYLEPTDSPSGVSEEHRSFENSAFIDVMVPVEMIGSCKVISFPVPESTRDSDETPIVSWKDGRMKNSSVIEYDPETAAVAFAGSQHWWSVNNNGGIYRLNGLTDVLDNNTLTSNESVELSKAIPEDEVLSDTVLEGVNKANITAISSGIVLDDDKLSYLGYRGGDSEVSESQAQGCSYK